MYGGFSVSSLLWDILSLCTDHFRERSLLNLQIHRFIKYWIFWIEKIAFLIPQDWEQNESNPPFSTEFNFPCVEICGMIFAVLISSFIFNNYKDIIMKFRQVVDMIKFHFLFLVPMGILLIIFILSYTWWHHSKIEWFMNRWFRVIRFWIRTILMFSAKSAPE